MSFYQIIFSPTGGTERAAAAVAGEIAGDWERIDLSEPMGTYEELAFEESDVCLVAVPSFGGRAPGAAVERLLRMKGNRARAVLIAVYGNRAYDDTLLELRDALARAGFRCAAAVAAVAEHSIMRQFGAGRPDGADREELMGFGKKIAALLGEETGETVLSVPGNAPYRDYQGVPFKPRGGKGCTRCGLCAKSCPVGAIPAESPETVDEKACISCMRCVAVCPKGARGVSKLLLAGAAQKMKKACGGRKPNELFLAGKA